MHSLKKLWESLNEARKRLGFGPVDLSEEVAALDAAKSKEKELEFHDYPPQRRAFIRKVSTSIWGFTEEIYIGCENSDTGSDDWPKVNELSRAVEKIPGITKCCTLPTVLGCGLSIGRNGIFFWEDVEGNIIRMVEWYFDIDVWAVEKQKFISPTSCVTKTCYEITKRNR